MGLGNLTQRQVTNLLVWADSQKQQAKNSVVRTTLTCGRPSESAEDEVKPGAYDNVRVYVKASGDADEIISTIRERLRTMNGTEVVYSSDEADLAVSLLGIKTKSTGGYENGVAFSVVVTRPCVWKMGTYTSRHDAFADQFVQVGSNNSEVAGSIVSSIDIHDLEDQRMANAATKKLLQNLKK